MKLLIYTFCLFALGACSAKPLATRLPSSTEADTVVLKKYAGTLDIASDEESLLPPKNSQCFLSHEKNRYGHFIRVKSGSYQYKMDVVDDWYENYYNTPTPKSSPKFSKFNKTGAVLYTATQPSTLYEIYAQNDPKQQWHTFGAKKFEATFNTFEIDRDYYVMPLNEFDNERELVNFVNANYDRALQTKNFKNLIIVNNKLKLEEVNGNATNYSFYYHEVGNGSSMGDKTHPLADQKYRAIAVKFVNIMYFKCKNLVLQK